MSPPEPTQQASPLKDGLAVVGALLANLALATLLYWNALSSAGRRVVGAENTETWTFLWGHFWMAHSLLQEGKFPLHTTLLGFPGGGTLWLKDPLWLMAMLPVQLTSGLPLASTMAQILQLTLAGLALFLLARLLGAGRLVSLVGSLTFCACPHVLGEAYNGNAEALNGGLMALWLWAMLRAARHGSPRRPWSVLWAGLALAALLISNQYYGLAMFMVSGPVLLLGILKWRGERTWWRQALAVAAGVGVGVLLCAYPLWLLHQSTLATDALTILNTGPVRLEPPYVSDLLHVLRPLSPLGKLDQQAPPFQDLVYPGLALLCVAHLAPLLGRQDRFRWLWPALGLSFLSLSLGPVLSVDGEMIQLGGQYVYLPWHYLEGAPLFGQMSLPHRMMVPAGLFLSLGTIWTLDGLNRRLSKGWGRWVVPPVVALLGLAMLAEVLTYPPYHVPLATVDVQPPAHAKLLAQVPGRGGVLNLPLLMGHNQFRRYYLYQATHTRPMAASMRHGEAPPAAHMDPWLISMARFLKEETKEPPKADPKARERLASLGFSHVVFHCRFWSHQWDDKSLYNITGTMIETFGKGVSLPDGAIVFALDPGGRERDRRLARKLWPKFNLDQRLVQPEPEDNMEIQPGPDHQ